VYQKVDQVAQVIFDRIVQSSLPHFVDSFKEWTYASHWE